MNALYILGQDAFNLIYGPSERAAIDQLTNNIAPQQTAESIVQNLDLLANVDIIFSGWGAPTLDEAFLDTAPNLKAFFYGAGTVRGFVTDAFWERDIMLTSSWAANAVPVSEYTIATILLSLKRFWHYAFTIRQTGTYLPKDEAKGAFDATVGLISLGMIGRLVCQRLQPFNLNVIAYDPFVSADDAARLGVTLVALADVFRQADVVSLHAPWLPETVGLIRGTHLASMKPNATFINTARGAIVREEEMIRILQQRPDLWAILDVVYPEPPAPDNPLLSLPNVVLTPHIAGSMNEECRRMGQYVIADLKRYLAGESLQWAVTREMAERMA